MVDRRTRAALERTRPAAFVVPFSLALVIALSYLAGGSLAATHWTAEALDLGAVAALAAAVMGLIAVLGVSGTIPLTAFALVVGLAIGHFGSGDLTARPGDPSSIAFGAVVLRRLASDAAFGPGGLNSALFSLLAAATGALGAWETVRIRRPHLALAPVTGLYSLGILNSSGDQVPGTIAFLGMALLLWLVTAFSRLRRAAGAEGLRVTGAARSRILAIGGSVAIGAVAVAGVAPPLTSRDASGIFDAGLTSLRTALGASSPGSEVGFSFDVPLRGSLTTSSEVVLTYTYDGVSPTAAPLYLRGVNLSQTTGGQWRVNLGGLRRVLLSGRTVSFGETYQEQAPMTVHVRVVNPPPAAPALAFYPGQLVGADAALLVTTLDPFRVGRSGVLTTDEAQLLTSPATSYTIQSLVSTATDAQLTAAGTAYPAWVAPYRSFESGYRPAATMGRIRALALRISAQAVTPYARAKAVESYLRSNYAYTLTPPPAPAATDPIDYFLFTSRSGYCQFYATAMGDLLRSLGIPTRLVNGFGPGTASGQGGSYTVTLGDAHTWVEAYFPNFGWIPFEPTPQVGFTPLARGPAIAAGTAPVAVSPDPTSAPTPVSGAPSAGSAAPAGRSVPEHPRDLPWGVLLTALLLAAAVLAAAVAWRPRDVAGAWRRIRFAGGLAGIEARGCDTPHEFGSRVAAAYPELWVLVTPVVEAYSEVIYSRRNRPASVATVIDGWSRLGPELLRRSLRRALRLA